MADPFIGEIKMFGGNFAPVGYAFCNGDLMAISQNETLFTLIGTTYGGDGQNNFGLPNLQGRIPVHQGSGFALGQSAGTENTTITTQQLPSHNHPLNASSNNGETGNPSGKAPAANSTANIYSPTAATASLGNGSISVIGGSQPHDNMMPFLCVSFIIALEGIYPTQN